MLHACILLYHPNRPFENPHPPFMESCAKSRVFGTINQAVVVHTTVEANVVAASSAHKPFRRSFKMFRVLQDLFVWNAFYDEIAQCLHSLNTYLRHVTACATRMTTYDNKKWRKTQNSQAKRVKAKGRLADLGITSWQTSAHAAQTRINLSLLWLYGCK